MLAPAPRNDRSTPDHALPEPLAPEKPAAHSRSHAHSHIHSHIHSHAHPHTHPHSRAAAPRSLMALSAGQRLFIALPLILALWLATLWAVH